MSYSYCSNINKWPEISGPVETVPRFISRLLAEIIVKYNATVTNGIDSVLIRPLRAQSNRQFQGAPIGQAHWAELNQAQVLLMEHGTRES